MQKDSRKSIGKMFAYLFFLIIMIVAIAGCIKVVWSHLHGDSSEAATPDSLCNNAQAQQSLDAAGLGKYTQRNCR